VTRSRQWNYGVEAEGIALSDIRRSPWSRAVSANSSGWTRIRPGLRRSARGSCTSFGDMEITALSACALSEQLRRRAVSSREVMVAYLDRIAERNPDCNAIVSLADRGLLLEQAELKDAELLRDTTDGAAVGWMHGMPQAIKDLADAAGFPTTLGSPLTGRAPARSDGLIVQRMRAAGCIVIGKTNTPEFGLGSHTFNEVFGTTTNAYDLSKTAGGSSGGAAVALATHMLPVADGSDYAGSLRNPAAWNNVFGFRPSQGRVPMWPVHDVWVAQLATEGPMGRTVADVAHLLDVQAGYDPRVPLSLHPERFNADLDGLNVRRTRIGWLGDLNGYLQIEPGILDVCADGLRRFESLGCSVEPIAVPFSPAEVWDAWRVWRAWLVAPRVKPFMDTRQRRDRVKPEAQWEYEQSLDLSADDVTRASIVRSAFYAHVLQLFERVDYLALPTAQVWPFDASVRWPAAINGVAMDTYHRWMEVVIYATFAGLPCMSVPVGFSAGGLPMGMQLIGRPRGDLSVLQVAYAYERTIEHILSVRPLGPAAA
jgi:amidase